MKLSINKLVTSFLFVSAVPIFIDLSNVIFFLYANDTMRIYSIAPATLISLVVALALSFIVYLYSSLVSNFKLILPNYSRYIFFLFVFPPNLFLLLYLYGFRIVQAKQLYTGFFILYHFSIPLPTVSFIQSSIFFAYGISLWLILHYFVHNAFFSLIFGLGFFAFILLVIVAFLGNFYTRSEIVAYKTQSPNLFCSVSCFYLLMPIHCLIQGSRNLCLPALYS